MESNHDSTIDLPISANAMAVLSKAAKRHVQKQQLQFLQQTRSYYKRQLKSSGDHRRKPPMMFDSGRPEVQSAPPAVQPCIKSSVSFQYRAPRSHRAAPKIFVLRPDPDSRDVSIHGESPRDHGLPAVGMHHDNDVEIEYQQSIRDTVFKEPVDSHRQLSPEGKQKHYLETPRSTASGTDWAWVRERLTSRESRTTRPESSMTFSDFLDCLDLESDEYDTDLEDDFVNCDVGDDDPTGIWHYRRMCRIQGIAPAQQIISKLSEENVYFQLNHRCLSNTDTLALTNGLSHNAFVQSVDLSDNSIKDSSARHISDMLRKNAVIKQLDLSNNYLSYNGGICLSDVLRTNSSLTYLCVSSNKLRDQEALLLCEALRSNETLTSLDVSRNNFFDDAGQAFAAALMDNCSLTSLNISWNSMGKFAASALGKAMKVNKTLRSLDVSWNGIGDDGAALLARPLRTNTTLRHLNLAVNHIGPFGSERLAEGICGSRVGRRIKKSSSGLRTLILDRNPLGRKGLAAFMQHLEKSEKLLDFSIKEVVLAPELLSSLRRLLKSRQMSIFFEGQTFFEKQECAVRFVANTVNSVSLRSRLQVADFLSSLSVNGAVPLNSLVTALRKSKHTSELEVNRFVDQLKIRGDFPIKYEDIAKHISSSPVSTVLSRKSKRKMSKVKFA